MISLQDVECTYAANQHDGLTIKGINLTILPGEIFGIIGRSGAGKSTLLRCINRLEKPTTGNVIVDQKNITLMEDNELRMARRNIGMIFQHFNLLSSRTVYENVALPLELIGATPREIELTVNPLLEMTGLHDKSKAYPYMLSGGQKQRVGIARALVNKPKVLLCDEATASLDPKNTHAILKLLQDINEKLKLTIVIITHEMEVIKTICQRVAVLHHGRIIEEDTVLKLFTEPKSDIAKEFIKSTTRLELPVIIRRKMQSHYIESGNFILRLSFTGENAQDSVIALIIKNFKLHINIIQAHLENIQGQSIGIMIIEAQGPQDNITQAIEFLTQKNLHVEVLGYVPRTA